ncbi:MAG TPA: serine/threonine-protein kinase [Labilithrix sp.]|nr:serine/threonine-protein kinase [Labilithrix sp.]
MHDDTKATAGRRRSGSHAEQVSETRLRSSRYRFTQRIAQGGMGAVYIGVQRGAAGFERLVAIKRTHGHLLDDPDTREMILREARNASAVRHPNVVSINDVEEIDGELILVMDYVDGGSLSQLLKSGKRLPIGVVLSIVLDACAGLSAIHTAKDHHGMVLGLVHRDVSPQNILVGLDGAARITDFGIAKSIRDPSRTAKSVRRGKFGYMAPEYLLAGASSTGSDVFALGVVLWEALAGRRLFKGETDQDSIRLTSAAEVPSLREIHPEVTPELEEVVRMALARSPLDRLQSMADFGQQLEAATQGLVAPRSEVSEWVAKTNPIRPSLPQAVHAETLSASDVELGDEERSAPARSDGDASVDEAPDEERAGAERELPSDAEEPSGSMDGPPIRFKAPSPRLHRVFRLEEVSEPRAGSSSSHPIGPSLETWRPRALEPQTSPSARRSRFLVAGAAAFVAFVVTSTAVLTYVGLRSDPNAEVMQQAR